MITVLSFVGFCFVTNLLLALALMFVGRWLRFGRQGFLRACGTVALWWLLGVVGFCFFEGHAWSAGATIAIALGGFAAGVALELEILRRIQRATLGRAAAGWGLMWIPRAILIVAALLLIRNHVFTAYRMPTLGMAPTLLSIHATAPCPYCGGTVYYDLDPSELNLARRFNASGGAAPETVTGTCIDCGGTVTAKLDSLTRLPADHFLVANFLVPVRWDIVAYHAKQDIYVKRVVGLPGERVSIDAAGNVSINGKRIPPPEGIVGFAWPDVAALGDALKVKPGEDLQLASDEYFVIGDNSRESADSRYYGPIRRSDLVGVVTWIYLPLSRERIFR